jgi:hypothetical protein
MYLTTHIEMTTKSSSFGSATAHRRSRLHQRRLLRHRQPRRRCLLPRWMIPSFDFRSYVMSAMFLLSKILERSVRHFVLARHWFTTIFATMWSSRLCDRFTCVKTMWWAISMFKFVKSMRRLLGTPIGYSGVSAHKTMRRMSYWGHEWRCTNPYYIVTVLYMIWRSCLERIGVSWPQWEVANPSLNSND